MKRNQKGFSLVELIIVIAIMAVLIGLLAPQYLRFVSRAKVNTDIQNAVSIADAVNAAIIDNGIGSLSSPITGAGGTSVSGVPSLTALPNSKVNASYSWTITFTEDDGVTEIQLNGKKIFPGDSSSLEYYSSYYH